MRRRRCRSGVGDGVSSFDEVKCDGRGGWDDNGRMGSGNQMASACACAVRFLDGGSKVNLPFSCFYPPFSNVSSVVER